LNANSPDFRAAGDASGAGGSFLSKDQKAESVAQKIKTAANYRSLFDAMNDGFCVIEVLFADSGKPYDYRFLEVNRAFGEQCGLPDALNRRVLEMVPNLEQRWFDTFGRVATTGEEVRFEDYAAGLERWFSIYAFRLGDPGDNVVAVFFSNINEAKQASRRVEFLSGLSRQLDALGQAPEQEIIRTALGALGPFLGCDRCYFVECLESDSLIVASENWLRGGSPSVAGRHNLFAFGGMTWWRQYAAGDFVVEDVETNPLTRENKENYAQIQVRSYAVQSFRREGETVVALAGTETAPRKWSEDDLRLMEDVAARVWPVVERARSDAALRRSVADLASAAAAAERANRAKDEFLAALSHELRTPLTPVLMIASSLRADARLPADVRDLLTGIERNVALEARLIDDLLDLTAVSHGKLLLRRETVDAHSLIGHAIEIVRADAEAKGVAIKRVLEAGHSGLSADPARLQQVVWNLLRNAVKFTPAGGSIVVRTMDAVGPRNQPMLRIEVKDTGVGIAPDYTEQIFQPFHQGQLTVQQRFGGIGLGLTIARAVVERHGGRIFATSEGINRGATFTVELHEVTAPPGGLGQGSMDETSAELDRANPQVAKLRLLLVEDHEPTLKTLAQLLRQQGHTVKETTSVAQALAAADTDQFDLVISDMGLGDGTGPELMARLRSKQALKGIALSGYGMDEDLALSRAAGFMAHLVKPIRFGDLTKTIAMVTSGQPTLDNRP
jgi:signal transduction histidine kinase/ActR/RegA family two-component response regulator/PAS domain-containing protein